MSWDLLAPLAPEDRARVLASARRRRFARGEVVFHEGDPGDTLHLVARGHLAVRVTTPLGDVVTLLVYGPGDFFGELAVLSPGARNSTIVALDRAETLSLGRGAVTDLRRHDPRIDDAFVQGLVTEVRRLSAALLEALHVPADQRVLRRLADLAGVYGPVGDGPVTVPLTQETIAQMAGTTRPTANRALRKAEADGLVAMARGAIEVRDPVALRQSSR